MFRRFTKTRALVALSVVAALAIAGAAYAYFSSSGNGTGQAKVGSSSSFNVSFGTTTGAMTPGGDTSTVPYTISNPSNGSQNLSSTTVAVADDGTGLITEKGTAVKDCQSSWFTAKDNPPTYGVIAGGGSVSGSVTVSMKNVAVSQDGCQGHTPDITVNAN
jgi:hypothetical protein